MIQSAQPFGHYRIFDIVIFLLNKSRQPSLLDYSGLFFGELEELITNTHR